MTVGQLVPFLFIGAVFTIWFVKQLDELARDQENNVTELRPLPGFTGHPTTTTGAAMSIDPGLLAQLDREKAVLDRAVTGLVDLYRDIHSDSGDSTIATFALMANISHIEDWKLMAALAAAVHRLADTGEQQ